MRRRRTEITRHLRETGDEASPEGTRVCEAMRQDNIRKYTVTYDDDLMRGEVREGGKCGSSASIRRLGCGVE